MVYTWRNIGDITRLVFGLVRFSETVFEDQGRCPTCQLFGKNTGPLQLTCPLKILPSQKSRKTTIFQGLCSVRFGECGFLHHFPPINFKNPNLYNFVKLGAQTMVGSHKVAVSGNVTLRVMAKWETFSGKSWHFTRPRMTTNMEIP